MVLIRPREDQRFAQSGDLREDGWHVAAPPYIVLAGEEAGPREVHVAVVESGIERAAPTVNHGDVGTDSRRRALEHALDLTVSHEHTGAARYQPAGRAQASVRERDGADHALRCSTPTCSKMASLR